MKKKVFLTSVLIAILSFALNAQTVVDGAIIIDPAEGYYNGSADYSGSGNQETFNYSENGTNFYVNYTNTGTYDYWSGFAYSNQTDLNTADRTNYSAYANPAGGADGSSNYGFVYSYLNDSLMFDNLVHIDSVKITNTVWAYKYMTGTDGSGTGLYENGDSLTLSITGIKEDNSYTDNSINFDLGRNTTIIDNWTNIYLTALGNVKGLIFKLSSSDSYTPYYFAFDNLTYSNPASTEKKSNQLISVYPNPVSDIVNIKNILNSNIIISDITGKIIYTKTNCNMLERINFSNVNPGIYFVKVKNQSRIFVNKIIKQ